MLETSPPSNGLLFGSFLYQEDLHSEKDLISRWEGVYGPSMIHRPSFNPLADYYTTEMGSPLKRFFLTSTTTYPRDFMLTGKLLMMAWEKEWSVEGKRAVNIDVGFLTVENFILATTKIYSHRFYLAQNIFGDLTYYFHEGKLRSLPWTYPDFQDPEKIEYFQWLRAFLLQKNLAKNSE